MAPKSVILIILSEIFAPVIMDNNESRLLIRSDSILRKVSADIFESPKAQIRMHTKLSS